MTFNKYKSKVRTDLVNLVAYMKPANVKLVQASIAQASTISQLDAISLGLNFHKFRVGRRNETK